MDRLRGVVTLLQSFITNSYLCISEQRQIDPVKSQNSNSPSQLSSSKMDTNFDGLLLWWQLSRGNRGIADYFIMLCRCDPKRAVFAFAMLSLSSASSLRNDQRNSQSDIEYIDHVTTKRARVLGNITKDLRIINGYSAPEIRYPYTASLQLFEKHYCGGALVAADIVITAAHCAENSPLITLGRYDLDDPLDYDYEEMNVISKIVHPEFDKVVVDNDVALLILEKQSMHPIIRINNDPNVPVDKEELSVVGWGDIDDHPTVKEVSDELREAKVWYVPNIECEKSKGIIKTNSGYQEASYNNELTDNMLCAKDHIGTVSDACQGDSGGALVRTGSHPTGEDDVLVGLVSWGYGCADPNCELQSILRDMTCV